ncbi:MAG: diaminopimelate decarboxylase [Bacteroidota bacterium]
MASPIQTALPLKVPAYPELLRQAAGRFGTPTFVYHEPIIRDRIDRLRAHLEGIPLRLLYAMKANSSPALLQIMRDEGLGLDAVSPGELALALQLGFDPGSILYSANNLTDDEMHRAAQAGVLLNIGERSRLDKYGQAYPGSAVCLRINPNVGAGHHRHVVTAGGKTKFGIPVEELGAAIEMAHRYNLQIRGLHQHIGSGILEAEHLWQAGHVLLEAALHLPDLDFINLGGGLGIPYRPGEAGLDFERFRERLVGPLQTFLARHPSPNLSIVFEPGRYLVAESGVLLTTVNTLKEAHGRLFAGTDSGMNHLLRPALYQAYHAVYNLTNPEGPLRTYDVTGNICESGDLLAEDRAVQTIREADCLAVLDAGAYAMSMASTYNLRPLPAEVLHRPDGTLVQTRRRLTADELVAAWMHG